MWHSRVCGKGLCCIAERCATKGPSQNEAPATEEEELHHGHTTKSPLVAGDDAPFRWGRVRVKLKNEVVIDVRNDYEVRIGKFTGAEDPVTEAFREFPSWVENRFRLSTSESSESEDLRANTSPDDGRSTSDVGGEPETATTGEKAMRIAMYCTGGIRCEKATSYLIEKMFNEVYHLEGGILKYLKQVTPAKSL